VARGQSRERRQEGQGEIDSYQGSLLLLLYISWTDSSYALPCCRVQCRHARACLHTLRTRVRAHYSTAFAWFLLSFLVSASSACRTMVHAWCERSSGPHSRGRNGPEREECLAMSGSGEHMVYIVKRVMTTGDVGHDRRLYAIFGGTASQAVKRTTSVIRLDGHFFGLYAAGLAFVPHAPCSFTQFSSCYQILHAFGALASDYKLLNYCITRCVFRIMPITK
jgi:hypothetical protein